MDRQKSAFSRPGAISLAVPEQEGLAVLGGTQQMEKRKAASAKLDAISLRLDGIPWRRGEEGIEACRPDGLTFAPGTIVLLMGANGAGKSTLLEKMAGLRPPEGVLTAYGSDALWKRSRFRRSGLGLNGQALLCYSYASQAPEEGLFARSVGDELAYSLRPYGLTEGDNDERSREALDAVGWESKAWLERDPYLMSGGERRRTALAAVFAAPAPWLLLDEPTAGLDGEGHRTIAAKLRDLRAEGRGIVLVSHDSDWALPLADEVLLLDAAGTLRLCSREQLVRHPEWLAEAGMRVPEWLQAANRMWRSGVPAELTLDPVAAAEGWRARVERSSDGPTQGLVRETEEDCCAKGEQQAGEEHKVGGEGKLEEGKRAEKVRERGMRPGGKRHRLAGFDPRSVWLAYVLISFGLFALKDWPGLAAGGAVVLGLLAAGRVSLRRWRMLIVNYAVFSVVTSAIFASGAGSDWAMRGEAFADTLFTFMRTMLILLLGLAIPLVMSPLSLRRSLEQITTIRGKSPVWVQRGILAVALIMRFVPVLLELWERFAKIIRARGKTLAIGPVALGRQLRDTALPFLLALFRLGDEVALALESRGVGGTRAATRAQRLRWRARDYGLATGSLLLALGMWFVLRR
ncbi:ATP-binding cassette domain-containing protein [Cohnella cellulosilytica]|uniref:ATP-binding cassette domain-containing protein n=1 Tax=Cohnella cellulosilytica TaxID=986710 RepID=A0ABW2FG19_9BACL